jgi:RND superfamily putative drug exporter
MFGPVNWWLPTWIDRWLPHLSVEAADTPSTDDESAPHLSTRTV